MQYLYRIEVPKSPSQEKLFTELGLAEIHLPKETVVISKERGRQTIEEVLSTNAREREERVYHLANEKGILGSYEYSKLMADHKLLKEAGYAWTEGYDDWKEVSYFPELQTCLDVEKCPAHEIKTPQGFVIPPIPPLYSGDNQSTNQAPREERSLYKKSSKKSLWQHYVYCLKNFVSFEGRASITEFWSFILFFVLGGLIFSAESNTFTSYYDFAVNRWMGFDPFLGILSSSWVGLVYSIVFLLPLLAVTSRRLHDTGKSAWFLLFYLLPVAGYIVLFVFSLLPSDPHENAYGAIPTDEVEG